MCVVASDEVPVESLQLRVQLHVDGRIRGFDEDKIRGYLLRWRNADYVNKDPHAVAIASGMFDGDAESPNQSAVEDASQSSSDDEAVLEARRRREIRLRQSKNDRAQKAAKKILQDLEQSSSQPIPDNNQRNKAAKKRRSK